MNKEWKQPVLEVLDVSMTMGNSVGSVTDAAFPAGTPKSELTFS